MTNRASPRAKLSSANLLNAMPADTCLELYKNEVLKRSTKTNGKSDCVFSTRAIDAKVGYPRLQIPFRLVPPIFRDRCNNSLKGQLKVFLHQLSWRASGKDLPSYDSNNDLAHLCGKGRRSSDGSFGSCFNMDHLALLPHKLNMDAQRCKPAVRCPCCSHVIILCDHQPRCLAVLDE